MKVTHSMDTTENKFTSCEWWCTGQNVFINTLQSQLRSASAIWPEFAEWILVKSKQTDEQSAKEQEGRD